MACGVSQTPSGYCSERNLIYLREHNVNSYIKLQTHEKMKTRAYKKDISKHYNMKHSADEDCYYCYDGRKLEHIKTEKRNNNGYIQTYEVYSCNNCADCSYKSKCLYKYNEETDADKNKVMKINERWEELQAESHANITSEKVFSIVRYVPFKQKDISPISKEMRTLEDLIIVHQKKYIRNFCCLLLDEI